MNSFIITDDGISGVVDNKMFTVDRSHPNFTDVVDAVREKDWEKAVRLSNLARAVQQFASGSDIYVDTDAGCVMYNGQELHNTLTSRILRMMEDGFDITPMTNFLRNLMLNPSKRSVDELYTFLEKGNLPITEDGCFLAYKRVRKDYYDVHSGTVQSKPATLMDAEDMDSLPKVNIGAQRNVTVEFVDGVTTISMPRNAVDDRKENTCSEGLHFCSHEYLKSFSGERIIIMKINPADVVSIPADYNNTKGRTWKYQVIGELDEDQREQAVRENVLTDSVWDESDDLDGEYDPDNTDDSLVTDDDFILGYHDGYQDGRGHTARVYNKNDQGLYPYANGYISGYDDGRKRLAKQF